MSQTAELKRGGLREMYGLPRCVCHLVRWLDSITQSCTVVCTGTVTVFVVVQSGADGRK